jgi:hypothetical protein
LVVKKEITLDEEATKHINQIYPIVSTSHNKEYIAISSLRPVSVVQIDYNGNLVDHITSRGKGPSEIQSARFMGFDQNNNMVIYDKTLGAIKKFVKKRDTVITHKSPADSGISITSNHFKQCEGKWYLGIMPLDAFTSHSQDTSAITGIFDANFSLTTSLGRVDPYLQNHISVLQNPIIDVDCSKNRLFTSHYKIPFIQVYDINSFSKITRIDNMPPSFKLSNEFVPVVQNYREFREYLIEEQSISTFIAHTTDYILLAFKNETAAFYESREYTQRKHFLAVYSRKDFSLLGEIKIDGAPMGTTKEGYLISLIDDNPDNFVIKLLEIEQKI